MDITQNFLDHPIPDFAICPVDDTRISLDVFHLVMKGPPDGYYKDELFYFRVRLPVEYPLVRPQFSFRKHAKFPYLFDGELSLADFFFTQKWPDHSPTISINIRIHVEALYIRLAFWGRDHLYLLLPRIYLGAAPDRSSIFPTPN